MAGLIERFQAAIGASAVLTAPADTAPYLTDWRGRYRGRALAVLRPATTAEVAAVVRLCSETGTPMVPQGGNTGLVGGGTPDDSGRAVVISLGRLRAVRTLDTANNTITVEAGCLLAEVQAAASEAGRLFPLSLAAEGSCTIGGNLSTNAGGVQVLRYGNTRDLTLGLEVVLPSGEVWSGLRGLRKDNTGYDLKQLFIGAEGTLGFITAAVLKLYPQPSAKATAWLALTDPAAAVMLLAAAQARFDARLTAFELVSASTLALVLKHIPGARSPLTTVPVWSVLLELSDGGSQEELADALTAFVGLALEDGTVIDGALAQSQAQAAQFWALRENASEAQKVEGISIKHDVSVPVSSIPDFLDRAGKALAIAFPGVRIVAFGHLGDGNLHYNLSLPEAAANAGLIDRQAEANRIVHDLVDHQLGGSISAEHGVGQLKRDELTRYKSPLALELMRSVKRALDPQGLMNPGKVISSTI
jgi:FAD/FMN-containing dehydrogenase